MDRPKFPLKSDNFFLEFERTEKLEKKRDNKKNCTSKIVAIQQEFK